MTSNTEQAVWSYGEEPRVTDAPSTGLLAAFRGKFAMYRKLKTIPDNANLSLLEVLSPLLRRMPGNVPVLGRRYRRRKSALFEENLRLLNDVLAQSPIRGSYWIWGGLLLGWAREGGVISHDVGDADFAFCAADEALLESSEAALESAGFKRWLSFRNGAGERTERMYVRDGFRFEFFRMDDIGDGMYAYHMYGPGQAGTTEFVGHLPRQELEPFEFLGRTWLKPRDHEMMLNHCYGDWRTPNPGWSMSDDRSIVTRRAWRPSGNVAP